MPWDTPELHCDITVAQRETEPSTRADIQCLCARWRIHCETDIAPKKSSCPLQVIAFHNFFSHHKREIKNQQNVRCI